MELILILLIILGLILLYFKKKGSSEHFNSEQNSELTIKKTDHYKLVHKNKDFCVWEPKPINEYFPIGQVLTRKPFPPKHSEVLVNSRQLNIRPEDYELMGIDSNNMKIWMPVVPKTYGIVSVVFSKNKPSLNRIKILPKKFMKKTNLKSLVCKTSKVNVWDLHKSNYIFCNDVINQTKPKEIYSLDENKVKTKTKLQLSFSTSFLKIFEDSEISVWRPMNKKNYKILGDICLKSGVNPNNKYKVPLVHISNSTDPIDFNDVPVSKIDKISVWKPKCMDGYGCVGHLVSVNNKEPKNDIMACVPIEYLIESMKELIPLTNSLPNKKCLYNIYSNDKFLIGNNSYEIPEISYKIDFTKTLIEKNSGEIPYEIKFYTVGEYDLKDVVNVLSQRTGVAPNRFVNGRKVGDLLYITIDSSSKNSKEDTVDDILQTLIEILKKKPITIDEDSKIVSMIGNQTMKNEKIKLNNDNFLNKINTQ